MEILNRFGKKRYATPTSRVEQEKTQVKVLSNQQSNGKRISAPQIGACAGSDVHLFPHTQQPQQKLDPSLHQHFRDY